MPFELSNYLHISCPLDRDGDISSRVLSYPLQLVVEVKSLGAGLQVALHGVPELRSVNHLIHLAHNLLVLYFLSHYVIVVESQLHVHSVVHSRVPLKHI